jgi:hypothetical protein
MTADDSTRGESSGEWLVTSGERKRKTGVRATKSRGRAGERRGRLRSFFLVQRVRLVRLAAVVTDRPLAQIADLDMVGAKVALAFGALLVRFVRAVGAGTLHEPMLQGARARVHGEIGPNAMPPFRCKGGNAAPKTAAVSATADANGAHDDQCRSGRGPPCPYGAKRDPSADKRRPPQDDDPRRIVTRS